MMPVSKQNMPCTRKMTIYRLLASLSVWMFIDLDSETALKDLLNFER